MLPRPATLRHSQGITIGLTSTQHFFHPPTPPQLKKVYPATRNFQLFLRHLPFHRCRCHLRATSLQEIPQSFTSCTMTTAALVVQCISNVSRASLNPALTLQRGLTAHLHRRVVSSSRKDEELVAKMDLERKQIYARNFMNQSGLNPSEVGNCLSEATMMAPSTGVLEQTAISDEVSGPICLDMQATTPTAPRVVDAMLSHDTGLYSANLIGPHPKEIEKPWRNNRAFLRTHGPQSADNIPSDLGKWNDDLTSLSGPKVYGPKDIGAHNTHHIPKVRIVALGSGRGQERGIHSGTHANSLEFSFGEPSRMSAGKIHVPHSAPTPSPLCD
ncbi:hypothetical protein HOY80DRAFT_639807 [Tuber brumale]|nr:hypothetical protein HOY80DRAFT_639807 [Tuber brumale]